MILSMEHIYKNYYNGKLEVKSGRKSDRALHYACIELNTSPMKNVAPAEADAVADYIDENGLLNIIAGNIIFWIFTI